MPFKRLQKLGTSKTGPDRDEHSPDVDPQTVTWREGVVPARLGEFRRERITWRGFRGIERRKSQRPTKNVLKQA